MFRIRFGTFFYEVITKDLKANLFDKFSHLGGTAGLFSGVYLITLFEIIEGLFMLFVKLFLWLKYRGKTSNLVEVQELQAEENEKNVDIEVFEKKIQDMEKNMKKDMEKNMEKLNDIIEEKMNKQHRK